MFEKVRAVLVEVTSDESHDSKLFYLRIDPEKMDNPMYDLISLLETLKLGHSYAFKSYKM